MADAVIRAWSVRIRPSASGVTAEENPLKARTGLSTTLTMAAPQLDLPSTTIVTGTGLQMSALQTYLMLINNGTDTSSIETALNALLPLS